MGVLDQENVIEATTSDATSFTAACYGAPSGSTVNGSVDASAIAGATQVAVRGLDAYGTLVSANSGSFSTQLPNGMNDIAASALDASSNVLAVKIVRNQSVPGAINGENPITFAASDATSAQMISIANISSGGNPSPEVSASYETSNGTSFILGNGQGPSISYRVVPASEAAAGDWYAYETNDATTTGNPTTHELVGITQNTTSGGGSVLLTLPNPWSFIAPSAAKFPSMSFNYTGFAGDAAVVDQAQIAWQPTNTSTDEIDVYATASYQAGSTTVAIPNLTNLNGFLQSAASGATVYRLMEANGGTYDIFNVGRYPNSTLAFVQATGTYSEP
jgi:hypothetical protein